MFQLFKSFRDKDSGAVTVDWVVITAASVGLVVAVARMVQPETADLITMASDGVENETQNFSTDIDDFTSGG